MKRRLKTMISAILIFSMVFQTPVRAQEWNGEAAGSHAEASVTEAISDGDLTETGETSEEADESFAEEAKEDEEASEGAEESFAEDTKEDEEASEETEDAAAEETKSAESEETSGEDALSDEALTYAAAPVIPAEPAQGSDGYYRITEIAELYWFAEQVNKGRNTINGRLMNDIRDNTAVLVDGELNPDEDAVAAFHVWTPIGNYAINNKVYSGVFDGNGHAIRGLYCDVPDTDQIGLFGRIWTNKCIIRDLSVEDSYFAGRNYVGGICGYAYDSTVITGCSFAGVVNGALDNVGGICGQNGATLRECTNSGTVAGRNNVGGIVGNGGAESCVNSGAVTGASSVGGVSGTCGSVRYCSNTGAVTGTTNVGGVAGYVNRYGTCISSYNTGVLTGTSGVNGGVGTTYGSVTVNRLYALEGTCDNAGTGGAFKTEEQFASGEVCWLLNDSKTETLSGWYQNLTGADKDAYPVQDITHGRVVQSGEDYINGTMVNGFIDTPGGTAYQRPELVNGVYEISNAGELYWFAALTNGRDVDGTTFIRTDAAASAKLTADITVNENVLDANGDLNGAGSDLRVWNPIGNATDFTGNIDGNGHSISGLYLEDTTRKRAGFIGAAKGSTIQNITINDSYFSADTNVGGVCGIATECTFLDCHSGKNRIEATGNYAGGICGQTYSCKAFSNCSNGGVVIGNRYVGGVVSTTDAPVTDCSNSGKVTGGNWYVGGIVGQLGNVYGQPLNRITRCTNSGVVTGTCTDDAVMLGGVCGESGAVMTDCVNTGTVVSDTASQDGTKVGGGKIGGVCGNNTGVVLRCKNGALGTVTGRENVGGVIGGSENEVYSCCNAGTASSDNTDDITEVGGVIGYNNNQSIFYCYNAGTVSSAGGRVGGVTGNSSGNDATLTGCYNLGSVSGTSAVGGICGYANSSVVSMNASARGLRIWNSCNKGTVTGTGAKIGAINGEIASDSNRINTVGIEEATCFYLEGSCVAAGGGTSATQEEFTSGKVCWRLNGGSYDTKQNKYVIGRLCWYQTIGSDTDPVQDRAHGIVWYDGSAYSNIAFDSEGFSTTENFYGDPVYNEAGDYYEIRTASQLYWFAKEVNDGRRFLNARLKIYSLRVRCGYHAGKEQDRYEIQSK